MNMQALNLRLQRLFIGGVGLNARCWGRWESCLTDSRFLWLIKNESCSTILDRLFSEVDSESEQINRCFDSKQKYPSPYLFIPFKMTQTKRYIINFFPGASPCPSSSRFLQKAGIPAADGETSTAGPKTSILWLSFWFSIMIHPEPSKSSSRDSHPRFL